MTADRNGAQHGRDGKYTEKPATAPGPGAQLSTPDLQGEKSVNAPEVWGGGCECWVTPESMWTTHYGAVEPGSQIEYNPECPKHGDQTLATGSPSAAAPTMTRMTFGSHAAPRCRCGELARTGVDAAFDETPVCIDCYREGRW